MIRGEWRFRLPLLPNELLSSWLTRSAFAHGLAPYRFTNYFLPGIPVWNRDIDRSASDAVLTSLRDAAAMDLGLLQRSTLREMEAALSGRRSHPGTACFLSAVGVYHRTRRLHGLMYCPRCLAMPPAYFRREWRLAFLPVCRHHGCLLQDACPACDTPVVPHRVTGLNPTRCHQCGSSLLNFGENGKEHALSPRLASFTRGLHGCLSTGVCRIFGDEQSARDTFDGVRALISLSSLGYVRDPMRIHFGLPAQDAHSPSTKREEFEHLRISARIHSLELVERWAASWPSSFRDGAAAAHLTQKTFARLHLPPFLVKEVSKFPPGQTRMRAHSDSIFDDDLRLLRRRSLSEYRQVRAARLLKEAGVIVE